MVTGMYHPWRELRERGDEYQVHWLPFPDERVSAMSGTDIWMDPHLLQVERRCAITHEQVHIDLRHDGCQPEKEEARVRRITAERLIDMADLIRAAKWALSPEELADELFVTPEVVEDRISALHPMERHLVNMAIRKAWEHDDVDR